MITGLLWRTVAIAGLILSLCGSTSYDTVFIKSYNREAIYENRICRASYANTCIEQVCLTSEERDCLRDCRRLAKTKCVGH